MYFPTSTWLMRKKMFRVLPPASPPPYFRHFSSLYSVMSTEVHLNTTCGDGLVYMPSARGRAELRAGAAVVAIGVGSPVARLGADGRRRREARAAVGARGRAVGAELATQVLGARAAAVAIAVRGVRGNSDAVLGAGRHRGGDRHARAAVRAVGAVDAVCVLGGAGAAIVAEGVGVVETSVGAPPEGNAKEVSRRRRRRRRRRRETTVSWRTAACQPPGVIEELRWPHGGHGDCASARAGYGVRRWPAAGRGARRRGDLLRRSASSAPTSCCQGYCQG